MWTRLPDSNNADRHIIIASAIFVLIFIVGIVVYITGGTADAFTHLMYVPIILSAFYFGMGGALVASLLGGLALGPWMPSVVTDEVMQEPATWIFRIIMFIVIGLTASFLFKKIKRLKRNEIEKLFQHEVTGLPNVNKLRLELMKMAGKKEKFSLIGFRVTNIDDINRFAGYEIGVKSIVKAAELLKSYTGNTVFSIFTNIFAVIIPGNSDQSSCKAGTDFLSQFREPFSVDRFRIEFTIKGGIVNYPFNGTDPDVLLKRLDIALGQDVDGVGLINYNSIIEKKNKEIYELGISLFDAIKNGEFYIVYQPKRSLDEDRVEGVEALLRWNNSQKGQISPEIFIKIAEDIGLINEITKWVIKNVIEQIRKWKSEGILTKVAINISFRDLKDDAIVDYLKQSIDENIIDPAMIELELTERSAMKNVKRTEQILVELKEYGILVSLDDVGTGYNSLINFIKIPVDYLKIDKTFIDNITDNANRVMVESIIYFAHKTWKKVIAEGVETKDQLDILRDIGCDYIQGYYFSKPLLPEELKNYMLSNVK